MPGVLRSRWAEVRRADLNAAGLPAFDNGISETSPTEAQKEEAAQLLLKVEGLLQETYQGSFSLEKDVLKRAQQERESKESLYAWCTWISYVTYPLGWLMPIFQGGWTLGWTPRLRQPNKTLFAVRCKLLDRQDHCTAF